MDIYEDFQQSDASKSEQGQALLDQLLELIGQEDDTHFLKNSFTILVKIMALAAPDLHNKISAMIGEHKSEVDFDALYNEIAGQSMPTHPQALPSIPNFSVPQEPVAKSKSIFKKPTQLLSAIKAKRLKKTVFKEK